MKRSLFVVAIDGPAGAGKSITARLVAERLGFVYVDTGALYRALTLQVLRRKIPLDDTAGIEKLALESRFDLRNDNGRQEVVLDGDDVTEEIRLPEVTNSIGPISALPRVREVLVQRQREIARHSSAPGVVMEGRDIGTVVFPDADVKIFMLASIDVRTQRRHAELAARGVVSHVEQLREEMLRRDAQDMNRAAGALRRAEDAVDLDTTGLSIDEQVNFIINVVQQRTCSS